MNSPILVIIIVLVVLALIVLIIQENPTVIPPPPIPPSTAPTGEGVRGGVVDAVYDAKRKWQFRNDDIQSNNSAGVKVIGVSLPVYTPPSDVIYLPPS